MTGVEWWLTGAGMAGALVLIAVMVSIRRRRSHSTVDGDDFFAPVIPNDISPDHLVSVFDEAPVALCLFDVKGRILHANALFHALLGASATALETNFSSLVYAEDLDHCRLHQRDLLARRGSLSELDIRLLNAHGRVVWIRLGLRLIRDQRKRASHFIASCVDIGGGKRTDALAHVHEAKSQVLVSHMPVAIWFSPADDRRILFVNEAFERIYGLSRDLFYADPDCALRLVHTEDRETVRKTLGEGGLKGACDINYRIQRSDGSQRYVRHMERGVFDSRGNLLYRVNTVTDISSELRVRDELRAANDQLREANQRWQESARLDALTGCLNRGAFFEAAEKALQLEQRYKRSSTLVFFDLNNFKDVNDNFGHHVGDRALIAFVGQIRARLRTTDELGRYGGDEFVALLRETDALQARLLLATLAPVVVDAENGNSVILRFSAGVACSDDPAIDTVDDWTRIADSQMYYQRTRRNGR